MVLLHKEVLKINLIGKIITVMDSNNKTLVNKKGEVIDETKYTLSIKQGKNLKKLLKSHLTLKISYKGKEYLVEGKLLIGKPEDRIKK